MPIRIRIHDKRQKLCKSLIIREWWPSEVAIEWRLIRTEHARSGSYADPSKHCWALDLVREKCDGQQSAVAMNWRI